MPAMQKIVQTGRLLFPRGWSPLLRFVSGYSETAKMYPAKLKSGETLYLDLSQNMCHGYFYYGELRHEKFSSALFKSALKTGDTFVDVGANIGYFSILASKLVGAVGRVHAFEPMPEAIRVLKENTRDLTNVSLHEVAVSNNAGHAPFSVNECGDTSSLANNGSALREITVKLEKLDNILENESRVDVVKIDVEGFELEVLQGAVEIINRFEPLIYFEFISEYTDELGRSYGDYESFFSSFGYELSWVNPLYPDGDLEVKDQLSSYIVAFPNNDRWENLRRS